MNLLELRIEEAKTRCQRQAAWQALSTGLILGGSCSLLLLLLLSLLTFDSSGAAYGLRLTALIPLFAIPGILCRRALRRDVDLQEAARLIDDCYNLPESACSALALQQNLNSEKMPVSPWQALQLQDTIDRLAQSPDSVLTLRPLTGPRFWPFGISLALINLLLVWLTFDHQVVGIADTDSERSPQLEAALELVATASRAVADLGLAQSSDKLSASDKLPENRQFSSLQAVMDDLLKSVASASQANDLRALGAALQLDPETNAAGRALQQERWKEAAELIRKISFDELPEPARRGIVAEINRHLTRATDPHNTPANNSQLSNNNSASSSPSNPLRTAISQLAEGLSLADQQQLQSAQAILAEMAAAEEQRASMSVRLQTESARLKDLGSQAEAQRLAQTNAKEGNAGAGQGASKVAGDIRFRNPAESAFPTTNSQDSNQVLALPNTSGNVGATAPENVPLQMPELTLLRDFERENTAYMRQAEDLLRVTRIPRQQRDVVQTYFESLRRLQAEAARAEP